MKTGIESLYKHKIKAAIIIIILAAAFFVGDNTFLDRIRYGSKIESLRQEVESLKTENERRLRQLDALQGDGESLEKFAREHFLMTKTNEEIFLINE